MNQLTTTDTVTETENTLPNKEINIDSGNIESDRTKMEGTGVNTPSGLPQAVQASDKKEGVFSSASGAVVHEVMEVVEIKQDNQSLPQSLPLSFDAGVENIADQNGEEEVLVQASVNDGTTLEEHAKVSEVTYDSQMPEAPEATQEVVSESTQEEVASEVTQQVVSEGTQEEVVSEGTQEEVVKEGTQEVVKVDTQVGASEGTQEVVSELAEVTKETQVVIDVTESLKYAANKIAEQSTDQQFESQLDDNEQRDENGKVGVACNKPDNEVDEEVGVACNEPDDEEVGVASDEPDGIVSEGIDGGREIVKSIKRRLSIKKKPKNKPVTENSSPTAVQTPLEQGETFSIHSTAVLAIVGYP